MNKKNIIFLFPIIIFLSLVFNISNSSSFDLLPFALNNFHSGELLIETDKEEYSAGDSIKLSIKLRNNEGVVIPDTYLVIEIIKGCEKFYNVEERDCNIIYEKIVKVGHILPLESREITQEIKIPEDWTSDIYRIDVYWTSRLAPIYGAPSSFFNPAFKVIRIFGKTDQQLSVSILSTKTRTAGGLSQRGPGVFENSKFITIDLYVFATDTFSGKVVYKTCEFDDTLCEAGFKEYVTIKEFPINCKKGENYFEHKIEVAEKNTAYSVRMEIYDSSGKLYSIYRGRYVKLGEGAKIVKIGLKDISIRENEEYFVRMSLTGPLEPNRIYTSINNVTLKFTILDDNDKEIYTHIDIIPKLELNQLRAYEVKFLPNFSLENFRICVELSKDDNILDRYCSSKLLYETARKEIPEKTDFWSILAIIIMIAAIVTIFIIIKIKRRK
ncbi:MAG: hypothetical protein QXI77_02140 [Nanopusillaceae archaeon]